LYSCLLMNSLSNSLWLQSQYFVEYIYM
jgi:hypothetical protein